MGNRIDPKKVVFGAVLGGAVGGIAVSVLSLNNGNSLKGTCEKYSDKIRMLVQEIKENITDNINEKTGFVTDKTKEIIESIKDEIEEFPGLDNKDFKKGLLIGGILGGLLGSGTTLLCKATCEEKKCDQSSGWKQIAKEVLGVLDTKGQSRVEQPRQSKTMHDVFDFAMAGIQLWKNVNKR